MYLFFKDESSTRAKSGSQNPILMRTEVTGIFVDIYASINWTEQ
jgi:hypothetical protein